MWFPKSWKIIGRVVYQVWKFFVFRKALNKSVWYLSAGSARVQVRLEVEVGPGV